jgi:hypothetical protein
MQAGTREDAITELLVTWQQPETRAMLPVARLSFDGESYRFNYLPAAKSIDGFRPLIGFKDVEKSYESGEGPHTGLGDVWSHSLRTACCLSPFREIPRLYASSADELLAMCSSIARHVSKQGTGVNRILFRGQTREYTPPRGKTTLKALYGRDDVIEPSLVPSASRRPPSSATQMAFASVLELASVSPAVQQATWRSILGDRQKVAFAQHYGLATDALDLTEDVKVALWFALTRLDPATENDIVASPVDEDNVSVLYLFRVGEFDARAIDVVDSPSSRPALQRGWVSSGSWGWRANRAATRLEAAIYFPGSVRNALALPATTELFRPPTDEPVTRIAQELLESLPPPAPPRDACTEEGVTDGHGRVA